MTPDNVDPLEQALESWFQSLESGENPDIVAICNGDADLMAELRQVTDSEQLLIEEMRQGGGEAELPAETLGEYRLRHPIGHGGMGRVFLAEQEGLGRLVALKVLDNKAMADPRARLRFQREAEIAAALDHPNIVPIYSIGEDQGYFYIAMKWLTGPGLDQADLRGDARRVAEIGKTIAGSLEQAHACGVVHRDIKPANIVFDSDKPFIVDFGLARARTDPNLTQEGIVAGTLPYLAPEQIELKTAGHDPRTDIYALGATLYSLLVGHPPFKDDDQRRLARMIVVSEPPRIQLTESDRDLESIIFKALEKEPESRFKTAGEMADELDRFCRGLPIKTRSIGPARRLYRAVRRRKALALSLASLITLVFVFAALWFVNQSVADSQFQNGIKQARLDFEDGRRATARTLVGDLLARRPDDPEAASLLADLDARDAYDRFLDLAVDSPSLDNAENLRRAIAACERTGARALDPVVFDLSVILVHIRHGEYEEARKKLDALSGVPAAARTVAIFKLLVSDSPTWPDSLPEPSDSADAAILSASGLALLQRPEAEIRAELDRAHDLEDPNGHKRALQRFGVRYFECGDYEFARILFSSLQSEEKRSYVADRYLVHSNVLLGNLDEARSVLEGVPDEERDPFFFMVEGLLFQRSGDQEGFIASVENGLKRWPGHPHLCRQKAAILSQQGKPGEALRVLETIKIAARFGRTWELIEIAKRIARFAMIIPEGVGQKQDLDATQRETIAQIGRELDEMESNFKFPLTKAILLQYQGHVAMQLEGPMAALKKLRLAMATEPTYASIRTSFIDLVYNNATEGTDSSWIEPKARLRLLEELKDVIARHEAGVGIGEQPISKEQLGTAFYVLMGVARETNDAQTCLEAAIKAKPYWDPESEAGKYIQLVIERIKPKKEPAPEEPAK